MYVLVYILFLFRRLGNVKQIIFMNLGHGSTAQIIFFDYSNILYYFFFWTTFSNDLRRFDILLKEILQILPNS